MALGKQFFPSRAAMRPRPLGAPSHTSKHSASSALSAAVILDPTDYADLNPWHP